jgi:hypothetical protein
VLLTRSPLEHPRRGLSVRLACVKHAASVRPEPGSNSPTKTTSPTSQHTQKARRQPETQNQQDPSKQTSQPDPNQKSPANQQIRLSKSTLSSSQKTNTHHKPTPQNEGQISGATAPVYLGGLAPSTPGFLSCAEPVGSSWFRVSLDQDRRLL